MLLHLPLAHIMSFSPAILVPMMEVLKCALAMCSMWRFDLRRSIVAHGGLISMTPVFLMHRLAMHHPAIDYELSLVFQNNLHANGNVLRWSVC